ncbi:MAG: FeoB-associated Cys-rich membrane protein [Lachnospiraceae bacterium]
MGTFFVLAGICLVIILIIRKMIRDRKNGKTCCGSDCKNCKGRCN